MLALLFVKAFSLPLEIAAIVAGIYRLIDMGSTTINVMGDMVGTSLVAHSERESAGENMPSVSMRAESWRISVLIESGSGFTM